MLDPADRLAELLSQRIDRVAEHLGHAGVGPRLLHQGYVQTLVVLDNRVHGQLRVVHVADPAEDAVERPGIAEQLVRPVAPLARHDHKFASAVCAHRDRLDQPVHLD